MTNILIAGPHPDDQELGMGGTIARLAQQGHNILLLDMTNGEPTPHGSVAQRTKEWTRAAEILNGAATGGAPGSAAAAAGGSVKRRLLNLPNRELQHTLEARHMVAAAIREHQAAILFAPYPEDAHPDHRATTRIVEDARFDAKLTKVDPAKLPGAPIYPKWLFYYYCTHLRHVAAPSFCIDISDQIEAKLAAILAYESQFVLPEKNRPVVDWIKHMNAYMGSRIGTAYAEPFYTKEPLGLTSLEGVVM